MCQIRGRKIIIIIQLQFVTVVVIIIILIIMILIIIITTTFSPVCHLKPNIFSNCHTDGITQSEKGAIRPLLHACAHGHPQLTPSAFPENTYDYASLGILT